MEDAHSGARFGIVDHNTTSSYLYKDNTSRSNSIA